MRRIITSLLCLWLLFVLLLPCGALSLITHTRFTYLGYQTLIIGEDDAPWNFIHYKQIRSLGSFRVFNCIAGLPAYTYTLKDSASYWLKLEVWHTGMPDYLAHEVTYTVSDLAVEGDFRRLSPDAMVTDECYGATTHGIIEHENIQYHYYDEKLYGVVWVWNGVCFQLSATSPKESISVTESYPIDQNTVMAKLLKSETVADALQTLQSEMEESADWYRIEAIRMRWLIVPIVLGEIALIAITAIISSRITRKVMQNKTKMSLAESVSASSDDAASVEVAATQGSSSEETPPSDN